jgi:hypothetical protein|tara:strand:+ start:815 stop:1021 length:207 start_codon:yes stop_codon:yes gene_type:complete
MSWFCCLKKTQKNKKIVQFDNDIKQILINADENSIEGSFDSECTIDNNIIKANSNSVVVHGTSHYLPH